MVGRVVGGAVGTAGNPGGGLGRTAEDGQRRLNHEAGGGGQAGKSGVCYWQGAELVGRGDGPSRADGDRGTTARGGVPAENPFAERRERDGQRVYSSVPCGVAE